MKGRTQHSESLSTLPLVLHSSRGFKPRSRAPCLHTILPPTPPRPNHPLVVSPLAPRSLLSLESLWFGGSSLLPMGPLIPSFHNSESHPASKPFVHLSLLRPPHTSLQSGLCFPGILRALCLALRALTITFCTLPRPSVSLTCLNYPFPVGRSKERTLTARLLCRRGSSPLIPQILP